MRSLRGSRLLHPSASLALLVALISFLLGRLSVQTHDSTKAAECQPCQSHSLRESYDVPHASTWRPDPSDMYALIADAGLQKNKAVLRPAPSGVPTYTIAPFQILSRYPRITVFPNFLDEERAQAVIKQAANSMSASTLALHKGDTEESTKDVRTSQGTFLTSKSDRSGVLSWIEERIAQVTGIPSNHGEPFNVLKYEAGQHYDSHYDVFDPALYGPQKSNRMATVLVYLEAPEEGGETVFPLEGVDGLNRLRDIDYKACNIGYKYKPRAGDAVLFWSLTPDGNFDKHALHGGCPVVKGVKWVATKWIRDKPSRFS